MVRVIYANDPASVDYERFGISNAIVIDNTGVWRDEQGLGQHLQAKGVARVILTAPGKGAIKDIVSGVNSHLINQNDRLLAAASCTTNAIVPAMKAMNDEFGIEHGHMETVHAYTNDQNLTDNFHKKNRRGRGAPLNMVITETGASSAVAKLLPELEGKLTGNAIRVPTPNVSLAILNLALERKTTLAEVNEYLRDMSLHSSLQRQIEYTGLDGSGVFGLRREALRLHDRRRRDHRRQEPGGPLRVVRQRVRVRLPGHPGGAEVGRHQLPAHSGRRGQNRLRLISFERRYAAQTP